MNQEFVTRKNEIEHIIEQYLPKEEGFQKTILQAMNDAMRAGGKRIRPMLMLETYRLFGGRDAVVEPFMVAIEMIHTSSLVHDDLPCMDNDELRRGKPTTWVTYGYDMAVLAGDALLIYAIETATKAFALSTNPDRVGRAIAILSSKTGIYGMIGGQVVDVELTNKEISEEKLDFIYKLKTGALLEASMMIGAVLAGANEKEIKKIQEMALKIGLAFQIQDDILDVTSTKEELGKPVLSDEKNKKTTYVTIKGKQTAMEDVERISNEAITCLDSFSNKNIFLESLVRMLITRKH